MDEDSASELQITMKEADFCFHHNLLSTAILKYGSILECVLSIYAKNYSKEFNAAKLCLKAKDNKIYRKNFVTLIQVSHEMGLLEYDTMQYVEVLRNLRNFVHIHKKIILKVNFSENSAIMCRMTLVAAIKDIKKASD